MFIDALKIVGNLVEHAEIRRRVDRAAEVAIVPGEAFGTPGYARLSYALGDDDLAEGIGRIAKLVTDAG